MYLVTRIAQDELNTRYAANRTKIELNSSVKSKPCARLLNIIRALNDEIRKFSGFTQDLLNSHFSQTEKKNLFFLSLSDA